VVGFAIPDLLPLKHFRFTFPFFLIVPLLLEFTAPRFSPDILVVLPITLKTAFIYRLAPSLVTLSSYPFKVF